MHKLIICRINNGCYQLPSPKSSEYARVSPHTVQDFYKAEGIRGIQLLNALMTR